MKPLEKDEMPAIEKRLPRITVVTPAKNSERYLEETILSVIEQDYPNLEYIIIDGCSTDGTVEIIRRYEGSLAHWESTPDKTMYDAVAKGFDRATGDILAWINSDDLLEAGCLKRVGEHFLRHPGHQVIYFENIVVKDGWWVPNRPHADVGLGELLDCYIIYQDGVFFRRGAYESIGGLNRGLRVAGDYDLWLRLSRRYRLHRREGHVSTFRLVPGQLSMSNWDRYMKEVAMCRDALMADLSPLELKMALAAKRLRRLPNRLSRGFRIRAGRVWPIADENLGWAPVVEQPGTSVRDCWCPVCGGHPHRLLFSSPGGADRRIWRVYECRVCNLSFIFPRPMNAAPTPLSRVCGPGVERDARPSPESYHSPYKGGSIYAHAAVGRFNRLFELLKGRSISRPGAIEDAARIDEDPEGAVLVIGPSAVRTIEGLLGRGYGNLYGVVPDHKAAEAARSRGLAVSSEDVTISDWPGRPVDAIVLDHALGLTADPVGFLKSVSRLLSTNGRIYLTLPNYDSAFIDFYGPAWAHWRIPFDSFTASPKAVRKMAEKAGLRAVRLRTTTPARNICMSEESSRLGLGGLVYRGIEPTSISSVASQSADLGPASNGLDGPNPQRGIEAGAAGFSRGLDKAASVTLFSRLFLDPFLRGDCLHVKLVKR
jgi:glycosyltransferase involved in cell wall biosynthesis